MRSRTTLLIVDDSPDFQMLMKAFVTGQDYRVLTACDTLQATSLALREKPHIIIIDIGLPGGDGWLLLDRLKSNSHTQHIPIVVVTGQSTPGLADKAQAVGAAGFLSKPIEKDTFLATVHHVLAPTEQAPPHP